VRERHRRGDGAEVERAAEERAVELRLQQQVAPAAGAVLERQALLPDAGQ
jgi:hypothetical protein